MWYVKVNTVNSLNHVFLSTMACPYVTLICCVGDASDHVERERCSRVHLDAITSDNAGNIYAFRSEIREQTTISFQNWFPVALAVLILPSLSHL